MTIADANSFHIVEPHDLTQLASAVQPEQFGFKIVYQISSRKLNK